MFSFWGEKSWILTYKEKHINKYESGKKDRNNKRIRGE